MPGKHVTDQQRGLYMSSRLQGNTQRVSAAKAGISERTGRAIEKAQGKCKPVRRHWRTRKDPFALVWDSELVPLLNRTPTLTPITLLEHLQATRPDEYPDKLLRTLERRVKTWRALEGKPKEVIFRQKHPPGLRGLSDFTTLKRVTITIKGQCLKHLLYHFRLAFSGWSHLKVILGGESFTALAEGLQEALWRLGGAPKDHRTDSLSAAFKNLSRDEQEDTTARYEQLCGHYKMTPTRNNKGVGHENGSVEASHGHLKRRIEQALLLRGHANFDSVEAYQTGLDGVVNHHNRRYAQALAVEKTHLSPLPVDKTTAFTEVCAKVTSSSTIDIRRVTYSVPSQLIGEHLRIHLYHDRLEGYLGASPVITLTRLHASGRGKRRRQINYRHLIHSLVKKPQAFRYSQLRDDLLPNTAWETVWQFIDEQVSAKAACRLIVGLLQLADTYDCEDKLGRQLLVQIQKGQIPSLSQWSCQYRKPLPVPNIAVEQHPLAAYNALIQAASATFTRKEVHHGL